MLQHIHGTCIYRSIICRRRPTRWINSPLTLTADNRYFADIPPIYASLGELVTGENPGRLSPIERTMACNLGFALDDLAIAPIV